MRALWSIKRLFGTYELVDIRPVHLESKYTFYKPHETEIAALEVGDLVKLCFDGSVFGRFEASERMWVIVSEITDHGYVGTLDNIPFSLDQLKLGQTIEFNGYNIYDVLYEDKNKKARIEKELPETRQFWERCIVDDRILYDGAKIAFLGRDEPLPPSDDDLENGIIDSGWFITAASYEEVSAPDAFPCNKNHSRVALGAVLNLDDRILKLLDSPPNTAYLYDEDTKSFSKIYESD